MNIPHKWREQFPHALIEQQAIGESRADVFRLRKDGGAELFLKSEPLEEHGELAARSIESNLGQAWVRPFFEAYGAEPGSIRI